MTLDEYKTAYEDEGDATPGWDAIDAALEALYPGQRPMHWAAEVPHMLGGPDPLDGISAYRSSSGGAEHLHFCSYGFTNLYYDEAAVGKDFSRYGFELTFRLRQAASDDTQPGWVCHLMQNIARYVFSSGKWFEHGQWIPANGPIHADSSTDIVGLMFVTDPQLPAIDTPHGSVEFLQMVGLTSAEVDALKAGDTTTEAIAAALAQAGPLWVTDLARTGSCTA